MAEWSRDIRCLVNRDTLRARLQLGWGVQKALSTPPRPYIHHHMEGAGDQTRSLRSWSLQPECAVTYSTLHDRVAVRGWPLDLALKTPARETPPGLEERQGD